LVVHDAAELIALRVENVEVTWTAAINVVSAQFTSDQ
jgi:hypothetical protein